MLGYHDQNHGKMLKLERSIKVISLNSVFCRGCNLRSKKVVTYLWSRLHRLDLNSFKAKLHNFFQVLSLIETTFSSELCGLNEIENKHLYICSGPNSWQLPGRCWVLFFFICQVSFIISHISLFGIFISLLLVTDVFQRSS